MTKHDLKRKQAYEKEVQEIETYITGLNIEDDTYRNLLSEFIKGELIRPMYADGTYPDSERDFGEIIKSLAAHIIDTEITGNVTEQLKQLYDVVIRECEVYKDVFNRYKEGTATGTDLYLQEIRFYVTECVFDDVLNQYAVVSDNRYPELASFHTDNFAVLKDDTKQDCIDTIEYILSSFDILYPFAENAIETDDKERYYYASLFLDVFALRLSYPGQNIRKYYQ